MILLDHTALASRTRSLLQSVALAYFLQLLLAVGTKLEHIIAKLAYDVAARQTAVEGDLVVKPSDEHFWLGQPRIVLHLIHFILFQNAFELSFFFWILVSNHCGTPSPKCAHCSAQTPWLNTTSFIA